MAETPEWVRAYEERLPGFANALRGTIHVPPTHPMYRTYYDYAFWRFEQGQALARELGAIRPLAGATVLDIGSGVGGIGGRFAEAGARVVAIDVAWGFLRLSRAAFRDLGVSPLSLFASGERLPLRSQSCDLILGMDILEHVPDPQAMFDEIARCLKPDGMVCLQTGYRYDWKNIRRDPHYGLPLVVLLPRWLREWVVVSLTKRNPQLEDFYWFKSFREVFDCFARRGILLRRLGDVLLGGRLSRSSVVLGEPGDDLYLDGDPALGQGFHGPERSEGHSMRWSKGGGIVRLLRQPGHCEAVVRLAALDPRIQSRPQRVDFRAKDGPRISMELRSHAWVDCHIPLPNDRGAGWCDLEFSVHPTWSPRELGIADDRRLGVAVHSAELRSR